MPSKDKSPLFPLPRRRFLQGMAAGATAPPVQGAFARHDALQCCFCTPGMVMACKALLDRNPDPALDDIKDGLAGNLCKCGTYPKIFRAVQDAAAQMRKA